jgi:hypothetical protein
MDTNIVALRNVLVPIRGKYYRGRLSRHLTPTPKRTWVRVYFPNRRKLIHWSRAAQGAGLPIVPYNKIDKLELRAANRGGHQ